LDLKENLARGLNMILEPVRQHFTHNSDARNLFQKVQEYSKKQMEEKAKQGSA